MADDILTTVRSIINATSRPELRRVAEEVKRLLSEQIRRSWESRIDPDGAGWAPLKGPSYAGVLKKSRMHLLGYKETGEKRFAEKDDLAPHQSESFLSQSALKDVNRATVNDDGFEAAGYMLKRYWAWQNDGTNSTGWGPPIPARAFWEFGDDLLDTVADRLADQVIKQIGSAA
jgi:hypothetical protein